MSFDELLHKVDEAKNLNLPFVIYRMPEVRLVQAIVQKDDRLDYADDFSTSGFVMAPFDASRKAVLFAEKNTRRFSCNLKDGDLSYVNITKNQIQPSHLKEAKEKHLKLVKKGIKGIENGHFLKTVLSRSEIVKLDHLNIASIFQRLMSQYQSAFVYVWFHPKIGLWGGASPETLLKTKGNLFQTMSLAGTQKYTGTVDVLWGEKELREQQLVTEHIVESLEAIKLAVSDTYTKKAGNLLHLCNDIKGTLADGDSLKDLLEKLHPTAAVCGLPRKKVREFILREEGYDRSFYTGFLGEIHHRDKDDKASDEENFRSSESILFVNLRCMQLVEGQNSEAIIYVGGGITLDSDPLAEWQETVHKSLIMKSVIED